MSNVPIPPAQNPDNGEPANQAVQQLGHGFYAEQTVDGHGRPSGWAIFSASGEYVDEAHNLATAAAFVEQYAAADRSVSTSDGTADSAEVSTTGSDFAAPPVAVAEWAAPAWSTSSNTADGDVSYSWSHPELVVAVDELDDPGGRPIQVELAQADELQLTAEGVRVVRGKPFVCIESVALSVASAEHLARVLMDVVTHFENHGGVA